MLLPTSERCRLSFRRVSHLPSKNLSEGSPFLLMLVSGAVTFLCFFFSFQINPTNVVLLVCFSD